MAQSLSLYNDSIDVSITHEPMLSYIHSYILIHLMLLILYSYVYVCVYNKKKMMREMNFYDKENQAQGQRGKTEGSPIIGNLRA